MLVNVNDPKINVPQINPINPDKNAQGVQAVVYPILAQPKQQAQQSYLQRIWGWFKPSQPALPTPQPPQEAVKTNDKTQLIKVEQPGLLNKIAGIAQQGINKTRNIIGGTVEIAQDIGKVVRVFWDPATYLMTYQKKLAGEVDANVLSAETRLKTAIPDPQFYEFSLYLRNILLQNLSLKNDIPNFVVPYTRGKKVVIRKDLVDHLIKINLANGFANLAETLNKNKHQIPNYENQSPLVNFVALLSSRVGKLIPADKLAEIEKRRFANEGKNQDLTELKNMFGDISKELLVLFFPNGMNDIVMPGMEMNIVKWEYFQNLILDKVKSLIQNFFFQSYLPTKKSPQTKQGWVSKIQSYVGPHKIEPLVEAPTLFLTAFITKYIQTNPKAIDLVQGELKKYGINHGQQENRYRQLAEWGLQSVQSLLTSGDPALIRAGQFIKDLISDLTLCLISKGAGLLIPENEVINRNQFLKYIIELVIKKIQTMDGQTVPSDQFWRDFINDLPLPPLFKELLIGQCIKRADSFKNLLTQGKYYRDQIENFYNESLAKVKKHREGDALVNLTENIARRFVDIGSHQVTEALSVGRVADSMEELFAEYLPHITIDKQLKSWFKNNVNALTESIKDFALPGDLLKKGIHAILLKSLLLMTEQNRGDEIENNPTENFAANFLKRIFKAFKTAFPTFTEQQKNQLKEALKIQAELHIKIALNEERKRNIKQLKSQIEKAPTNTQLIEKQILLVSLVSQSESDIRALEIKLDNELGPFQVFAKELEDAIGLNHAEEFLPEVVRQHIWPWIESKKNQYAKQFLFEQLAPMVQILYDREETLKKLMAWDGQSLAIDLSKVCAKEIINVMASFITYKPAKDVFDLFPPIGYLATADECNIFNKEIERIIAEIGKNALTTEHLLHAYEKAIPEHKNRRNDSLLPNRQEALTLLHNQGIITKIKAEAYLPESLKASLQGAFPNVNIEELIVPQLRTLIKDTDVVIKTAFEDYIKDLILKLIVKLKEKHNTNNLISAFSKQLHAALEQSKHEPAEQRLKILLQTILKDILGINEEQAFPGIPPNLQKIAFNTVKESLSTAITPYLHPLINLDKDKHELKKLSGYFGSFCTALAKDTVNFIIPLSMQSYEGIATKIYQALNPDKPLENKITALSVKIAQLVELAKYSPTNKNPTPIKNKTLVEAYVEVEGINLTTEQKKGLVEKLKKIKVKDELNYLLITPAEIVETIALAFPTINENLQKGLTKELFNLTRLGSTTQGKAYTSLIQHYIETFFYKVFINIAKKNPAQVDEKGHVKKDCTVILIEKLLFEIKSSIQKVRSELDAIDLEYQLKIIPGSANEQDKINEKKQAVLKVVEKASEKLTAHIIKNILGIEAPTSFDGMPQAIQNIAFDLVNNQVHNLIKSLIFSSFEGMKSLENSHSEVMESRAHLEKLLGGNWATTVSADMAKLMIQSTQLLTEPVGPDLPSRGAALTAVAASNMLEEMIRNHVSFAKALYQKRRPEVYQKISEQLLIDLKNASESDHAKIGELIGNLLTQLLNRGLHHLVDVEMQAKEIGNINFITQLMQLLGDHFKVINQATQKGKKQTSYAELIQASQNLHPATPKTNLVNENQKVEIDIVYQPVAKKLLKILFPKGSNDLTFLAPELRLSMWRILKKQAPELLSNVIDTFLDEDTITSMLVSILETFRDNLKGPVVIEENVPKTPMSNLDLTCGEFLSQILDRVKLPPLILKKLIDPKTGKIDPSFKQSLGRSLRKQFNGNFMKQMLQSGFKTLATKNEKGEGLLTIDTSPAAQRLSNKNKNHLLLEKRLNQVTEDIVDEGIKSFIKEKWTYFQLKMDRIFAKLGKLGKTTKQALDACFRFIFFKIMGTILEFLTRPLRRWLRTKLFQYIKLEENRKLLFDPIRKANVGQPGPSNVVAFNKDLVFKFFVPKPLGTVGT